MYFLTHQVARFDLPPTRTELFRTKQLLANRKVANLFSKTEQF